MAESLLQTDGVIAYTAAPDKGSGYGLAITTAGIGSTFDEMPFLTPPSNTIANNANHDTAGMAQAKSENLCGACHREQAMSSRDISRSGLRHEAFFATNNILASAAYIGNNRGSGGSHFGELSLSGTSPPI